jgi:hypothetical protein
MTKHTIPMETCALCLSKRLERLERRVRQAEDRDIRAFVSEKWAKDWDSPEDAAYNPFEGEQP